MGWRPLTERLGKQICESHWTRHKDPADPFNLWDVFGFRKPAGMQKPGAKSAAQKDVLRFRRRMDTLCCRQCGGGREAGHTYCQSCARGRRQQAHQQRQRRYREKHIQAIKV